MLRAACVSLRAQSMHTPTPGFLVNRLRLLPHARNHLIGLKGINWALVAAEGQELLG